MVCVICLVRFVGDLCTGYMTVWGLWWGWFEFGGAGFVFGLGC